MPSTKVESSRHPIAGKVRGWCVAARGSSRVQAASAAPIAGAAARAYGVTAGVSGVPGLSNPFAVLTFYNLLHAAQASITVR